ncbi:dehydrogenase, partial [Mesorhizobium sp. M6A.T.Ca.TU.002.02.2.1]
MPELRHIGIIGYGAIGRQLAGRLLTDPKYRVTVLVRRAGDEPASTGLSFTTSLPELLADCPDLIVEAASAETFLTVGPRCLAMGIDVIAASVGALNTPETLRLLADICATSGA